MSVRKYFMEDVNKNQSKSQEDDILTKPNPATVSGMKNAVYDKLNERTRIC